MREFITKNHLQNDMKCEKCSRKTLVPLKIAGKQYCKKHFEELMEKRIRKHLRIRQKLNTNNTYTIESANKENKELMKIYLESIFNGRLKIKNVKNTEEDKIITTETADEIAKNFLDEFTDDKKHKEDKKIKPFQHLTNKELDELKKIHKIKIKKNNHKLKEKQDVLHELEKKYPGTIFSTIRTKEFLDKQRNTNVKRNQKNKKSKDLS